MNSGFVDGIHPETNDGDDADDYEEDVQAEEQAVYDEAHLDPLRALTTNPTLDLMVQNFQDPPQAPQLLQGLLIIQWSQLLWSVTGAHQSGYFWFCCRRNEEGEKWGKIFL